MTTLMYTQADRPLALTTPLGDDALLLERLSGTEGISTLFQFKLDLLAESGRDIAFDKVLGAPLSVRITDASGTPRTINGICSRFREGPPVQGSKGPATFVRYQAELVPQFWLWTRNNQSRIFQHMTVVDILKSVLKGLDFTASRLHGDFPTRTYCTQYRESDFAFASRLMEEEGIAYHFEHTDKGHTLVLTNDNAGFPQLPEEHRTLEIRVGEVAAQDGLLHPPLGEGAGDPRRQVHGSRSLVRAAAQRPGGAAVAARHHRRRRRQAHDPAGEQPGPRGVRLPRRSCGLLR